MTGRGVFKLIQDIKLPAILTLIALSTVTSALVLHGEEQPEEHPKELRTGPDRYKTHNPFAIPNSTSNVPSDPLSALSPANETPATGLEPSSSSGQLAGQAVEGGHFVPHYAPDSNDPGNDGGIAHAPEIQAEEFENPAVNATGRPGSPGYTQQTETAPPAPAARTGVRRKGGPPTSVTADSHASANQNEAGTAGNSQGQVTGPRASLPYLRNYRSDTGRSYKDNGRNSNVPGAPNTDIGQGGDTFGTSGNPIGAAP